MAAVIEPRKAVLKELISSCSAELSIAQYYVTECNPGFHLNRKAVSILGERGFEIRRHTFENFKSKVLSADWFRADGQILAVAGDRFVGLSAIGFESDDRTAFNAFTGIDQAYRGRKIAQALRILVAQYAISQGAQVIVTDNDSENAPMLAINNKMGYVRQPGTYWLVKRPWELTVS
jgi:GNAT superfamily N-acetyltransferase